MGEPTVGHTHSWSVRSAQDNVSCRHSGWRLRATSVSGLVLNTFSSRSLKLREGINVPTNT